MVRITDPTKFMTLMSAASDVPFADVDVRALTFRWSTGQVALQNVSLRAESGERIAIVGPSGAGKSTLLLHLNGLLPEQKPRAENPCIWIQGLPVQGVQLPEVRRRVGFLFQEPDDQLFCPTVWDDVAFGPLNLGCTPDEVRQRVNDSLSAVGLADQANRQPSQLSVGERKRVGLAGLFAMKPSILVLDEPTANLDPRSRRKLLAILQDLPQTQIVATHDLDFALDLCERTLILDEGCVQTDGRTAAVLSDPHLMDRHGLEVPWRLR